MSDIDPGRDNEARNNRRIWIMLLALGIGVPVVGAWVHTVDVPEGCVPEQPAQVHLNVSGGEPNFDAMAHDVVGADPDHHGETVQYLEDWNRPRDDGGMRTDKDIRQGDYYLFDEIYCADDPEADE